MYGRELITCRFELVYITKDEDTLRNKDNGENVVTLIMHLKSRHVKILILCFSALLFKSAVIKKSQFNYLVVTNH